MHASVCRCDGPLFSKDCGKVVGRRIVRHVGRIQRQLMLKRYLVFYCHLSTISSSLQEEKYDIKRMNEGNLAMSEQLLLRL